jgi:hypothetical protein
MIKKGEEVGKKGKSSFKRFSDMNKGSKTETTSGEAHQEVLPMEDQDIPGNPNLPVDSKKVPKSASTRVLKPLASEQDYDKEESSDSLIDSKTNEASDIKLYGKVAKLPKGTKASKGFNFLENVKISKNSIWYIMVEKQENELQMVKYNYKKGVDLSKFINDLKSYYSKKYQSNKKVIEMISNITIDGNDKYSWVKNIPLIEVDGKKMISKITEDLIKLLSK